MTKKAMIINMVKRNGFISYDAACKMVQWDLHNLHSTFRQSALDAAGLVKCTLNGVKGFTFRNKSRAVIALLKQQKTMTADQLKEVTGWDSNVMGSVFRNSVREEKGIEKDGAIYRMAK